LIDFFDESFELERAIRWGITRKSDNRLVGTCGYVWLRTYRGEISYELASPYWRQGIMAEALDGIVDFGFAEMGLNRIEAPVMVENVASAQLLRKLGFLEEGVLRQYDFFKGRFHDMRLFALLKEEYDAVAA
jgi:ribosomal-protein-alanine N-acetyltransferase